ncbi:MAG: hypothetical protein JHC71_06120, partial [Blastococcus sp.]|nr:hypothetical protein [Blastococcus sp.]
SAPRAAAPGEPAAVASPGDDDPSPLLGAGLAVAALVVVVATVVGRRRAVRRVPLPGPDVSGADR